MNSIIGNHERRKKILIGLDHLQWRGEESNRVYGLGVRKERKEAKWEGRIGSKSSSSYGTL